MSGRAARRRRPPQPPVLTLIRGDGSAPPDPPAPSETKECYVIQNVGLSGTTRLVLLHGDPRLPFGERAGVATFEISRGCAPADDESALIQGVLELLKAHGEKQWAREQQIRRFMGRAHLELVQ